MAIKFFIPRTVHAKIMHWVNKSDKEVSGFGKIQYNKEHKYFWVTDAYLLKQEAGSAHTDIDGSSLAKLMFETKDIEGDLNFWWHSHVKMKVFWSTTDKDTIIELGKNGYCLATVFNQKEEMRTALCYKSTSPFEDDTFEFKDELVTQVYDANISEAVKKKWDDEFDEKVSVRPTYGYSGSRGSYSGNRYGDDYYTGDWHKDYVTHKKKVEAEEKEKAEKKEEETDLGIEYAEDIEDKIEFKVRDYTPPMIPDAVFRRLEENLFAYEKTGIDEYTIQVASILNVDPEDMCLMSYFKRSLQDRLDKIHTEFYERHGA